MPTTTATPDRIVTCSIIARRSGNRCTGEAMDPDAELLICPRHAAEVMRMVEARMPSTVERLLGVAPTTRKQASR